MTELDQSDTAACATLKDHLNGKFGFSIIFLLCKVYFNLKYSYNCDVGCGGNSIDNFMFFASTSTKLNLSLFFVF